LLAQRSMIVEALRDQRSDRRHRPGLRQWGRPIGVGCITAIIRQILCRGEQPIPVAAPVRQIGILRGLEFGVAPVAVHHQVSGTQDIHIRDKPELVLDNDDADIEITREDV
jgi:hypothetical protein